MHEATKLNTKYISGHTNHTPKWLGLGWMEWKLMAFISSEKGNNAHSVYDPFCIKVPDKRGLLKISFVVTLLHPSRAYLTMNWVKVGRELWCDMMPNGAKPTMVWQSPFKSEYAKKTCLKIWLWSRMNTGYHDSWKKYEPNNNFGFFPIPGSQMNNFSC